MARDHVDGNLHSDAIIDVSVLARTYTVSYDTNGGTAVPSVTVDHGDTLTVPADPTLEDHAFTGWFSDAATTAPYDFAAPITADITLYAGWDETELGAGPVLPGDGDSGGDSGDGTPGDPGASTPEATVAGTSSPPGATLATTGRSLGLGLAAAAFLALTLGAGLVLRERHRAHTGAGGAR